jgi:N-acetyl-alpha-D-glucosaminyl L-malate synthase BshA
MRIAISCHSTQGGSGVVATELAMGLAGRGHDVHMVAVDRPFRLPADTPVQFHQVTVADYPLFKHPPDDLCLANKLAEVVVEQNIEVLHAHYVVPHTISAILAAQSVRPHPVRVVTTLHGTDITLVGSHRDFYRICRYAMIECDGLTAVSKWLCDRTMEEFDLPAEPEIVPNFVDCDRFSPGDRAGYQTPVELLHVSNFRPVKRIFDVVRVFDQIQRKIDARLTLVGDGPLRGMAEEQVAELGLCDRVRFLGAQTDVEPLYRRSHLFLLLSEYESFGLSALEAMACGTPVLCSRAGGLLEVVEEGVSGHLCPVGDIEELTRCGLRILEDADRWAQMSAASATRAKQNFCKDATMEQYEAFYQRVLDAGSVEAS